MAVHAAEALAKQLHRLVVAPREEQDRGDRMEKDLPEHESQEHPGEAELAGLEDDEQGVLWQVLGHLFLCRPEAKADPLPAVV